MPEVQGDGHPVPTSSFLLSTCISFLSKYLSNFFFFFFAENKGSLQDMQIYFETADFFFFLKDLSKDLQLILFKQLRSQPFISQKA